jgi:hypothetical protein
MRQLWTDAGEALEHKEPTRGKALRLSVKAAECVLVWLARLVGEEQQNAR